MSKETRGAALLNDPGAEETARETLKETIERELIRSLPTESAAAKFSQISHAQEAVALHDVPESAELETQIREFAERLVNARG